MFEELREITFELTNRCDLCCRICNIWKEDKKNDLSVDQIKKILQPLKIPLTISLTGGEPFLNPQIDKIYKYLFKLFLQGKIRDIDIATNAYSDKIQQFLKKNGNYLKPLSLSISVDGIGIKHNIQRGKNDAFKKTLKNILIIKKYNIPLTLKFVISKINYKELLKVYELSKKIGVNFNIKFMEKLPNYYHRQGKPLKLSVGKNKIPDVKKMMEKITDIENLNNKSISSFSLLCLKKFLKEGNLSFIKNCSTPKYSLFVTSHGDIYNCIYQERIATIETWPNLDWKKYIKNESSGKNNTCPKCLSYHGYLKEFNICFL